MRLNHGVTTVIVPRMHLRVASILLWFITMDYQPGSLSLFLNPELPVPEDVQASADRVNAVEMDIDSANKSSKRKHHDQAVVKRPSKRSKGNTEQAPADTKTAETSEGSEAEGDQA